MVSLVNSHTNATRIGWHLWEIDLRFAPGLPPGWNVGGARNLKVVLNERLLGRGKQKQRHTRVRPDHLWSHFVPGRQLSPQKLFTSTFAAKVVRPVLSTFAHLYLQQQRQSRVRTENLWSHLTR